MKNIKLMLLTLLFLTSYVSSEAPIESFLRKYPGSIYQDVVIGSDIHAIGSDQCESRYALIRPILEQYDRPFSLLDLGAAQGYFSFRIASDYPDSTCVMIEANNTSYYAQHGDMLYDLCQFNGHLDNIFYLNKKMDLTDLSFLNREEHFDVVIAFLVVHLMNDSLKEQIRIVQSLLSLGDNLILEVANDVDVIHTSYVEYLSHQLDCQYLGEVKRHKDLNSKSMGKLFWFKRKEPQTMNKNDVHLKKETFHRLCGAYPKEYDNEAY